MGAGPSQYDVRTASSYKLDESSPSDINNIPTQSEDPILQERSNMSPPLATIKKEPLERFFGKQDEDDTDRNPNDDGLYKWTKIGYIALICLTALSCLVCLILFGSHVNNNQDEDDEGSMDEDERILQRMSRRLCFSLVYLLLLSACCGLVGCLVFWDGVASTVPKRFRVGALIGSLVGYAMAAMTVVLYFWNRESQLNQDSRDGGGRYLDSKDYNYGYNDDQVNNNNSSGFGLDGACVFGLVLAGLYSAFALYCFWNQSILLKQKEDMGPKGTRTMSPDDLALTKSAAKADMLGDVWMAICVGSWIGLLVSLLIAPIPLVQGFEEQEQREEQGTGTWNYIVVLFFLFGILAILTKMGRDIFAQRNTSSQMAIGVFNGLVFYLGAIFFLLAFLYLNFQVTEEGRRRANDRGGMSTLGSGGFAILAFVYCGMYTYFAISAAKHHKAIIRANAKDVYSVEQWREPFVSCVELT